jgi:hypothetical protein
MNDNQAIEIPDEFRIVARWLNAETLVLGPQGMVAEAVRGTLTASERPVVRAFLDEVLSRVSDDQKLYDLLMGSGARLYMEGPAVARYLLSLMRDAV